MNECEHRWVHMDTFKEYAERASFGISSSKSWKRVDRFYCEKCLEFKAKVQTAPSYEDKPDWFD